MFTLPSEIFDSPQGYRKSRSLNALNRFPAEQAATLSTRRLGRWISTDLLAIPKTIREMRRRGIDEQTIRRAVFDNANEFYGLGLDG